MLDNTHGAEWNRWDLHVHTKGTHKNDQFTSPDMDSFCKILFKKAYQKKIVTIGITDYFLIDNYNNVLNYQKKIDSNSEFTPEEKEYIRKICLLPNIELRMLPVTDSGTLVNIHCIFNPAIVSSLNLEFYSKIKSNGTHYPLTKEGLIAYGKSLFDYEESSNDSNQEDENKYINKAVQSFVIDINNLKQIFEENLNLRDNTIIVVSNSNNDGASALQEHYKLFEGNSSNLDGLRKEIYKLSDCIFSSNPKDREFFLGKKEGISEKDVINKCGSIKPCIHGSDAHCEEKLFEPDQKRYCWIKAETSFNGLKQIIYEPEDRVCIREQKPEEKRTYQVIDSIQFNHEDFPKKPIYFNQNLTTIIGGRSSGKSILLGALAKYIDPTVIIKTDVNGKTSMHDHYVNDLCKNLTIKWKDEQKDQIRKIEYFRQSQINGYASDPKEIDKIIERIIKKNSVKNSAFEKYSFFKLNNQKEITNKIAELIDLRDKKYNIDNKIKEIGNKSGLQIEILKIKNEIEEIKRNQLGILTESEIKDYEILLESCHSLENEKSMLIKDNNTLSVLKNKEIISSITSEITGLSEETQKKINEFFASLKQDTQKKWFAFIDSLEKNNVNTIESHETNINNTYSSEIYKKGNTYFSSNEEYLQKDKLLKEEQFKLQQIEKLEKEQNTILENYHNLFKNILDLNYKYYEEITCLAKLIKENNSGVEISAEINFENEAYTKVLVESFNKQSGIGKGYTDFCFTNIKDFKKFLQTVLHCIDNDMIKLMKTTSLQTVLTAMLAINYFSISYKVKYEGDALDSMSEGKKAYIVLRLLLDFDEADWPILIDQPEDDLDNRAIFTDLVKYLKNKKKTRQIILVTHNPNIVVGADSELVIVANRHGSKNENPEKVKFCYYGDTLEHSFINKNEKTILYKKGIKEHVCEILEGGDAAFKLRENKYGYRLVGATK